MKFSSVTVGGAALLELMEQCAARVGVRLAGGARRARAISGDDASLPGVVLAVLRTCDKGGPADVVTAIGPRGGVTRQPRYRRTTTRGGWRDGDPYTATRVKTIPGAVCWHGHRDLMRAVVEQVPDCVITSALATYHGQDGFERDHGATAYGASSWQNAACEEAGRRHRQPVCDCGGEDADGAPLDYVHALPLAGVRGGVKVYASLEAWKRMTTRGEDGKRMAGALEGEVLASPVLPVRVIGGEATDEIARRVVEQGGGGTDESGSETDATTPANDHATEGGAK